MLAQGLLSQRQVDQPGLELRGYCCTLKLTGISLSKTACIASTSLDLCVLLEKNLFHFLAVNELEREQKALPTLVLAVRRKCL